MLRTMKPKHLPLRTLLVLSALATSCTGPSKAEQGASSVAEVLAYFEAQDKTVLTFVGYSGSGYQDEARMLEHVEATLAGYDPLTTIVNIGATSDGIGAAYPLAKARGFATTGIVSNRAQLYDAQISPYVDKAFFVADPAWGGFIDGGARLSPTSEAMVSVSDIVCGIGGGAVARDEMIAARRRKKTVVFRPAEMSHANALRKAKKKGSPQPTDFRGAAHAVFGRSSAR